MSSTTDTLFRVYTEEVADIRRVLHYNNSTLDVEEILKKDVRLSYTSNHCQRFMIAIGFLEGRKLNTGEDYFYVSFILSQDEYLPNQAMGYMLARSARKLGFAGNADVPDMDTYIEGLENCFHANITRAG